MKKLFAFLVVALLFVGVQDVWAIGDVGSQPEYAYNAVPKTAECCNDPTEHAGPEYINVAFSSEKDYDCRWQRFVATASGQNGAIAGILIQATQGTNESGTCTNRHKVKLDCSSQNREVLNLTPRQVKACQSELLAYVTALDLRCDDDSKFLAFTPNTTVRMVKCRQPTKGSKFNPNPQ